MGGGSDGGGTQIIQPPVNNATPLQGPLINASTVALSSNDALNPWGAGARLTPNVPFGQVAFAGPNQTIYGNAFGANSTPFYGQPSMTQAQINAQMMGGGAGGGQGAGGGGGGAAQQGGGNPQQASNGYQFGILPGQQAQYQHVIAPFQQMFPGIFPQSGTPSPFGAGFNPNPAGSGGIPVMQQGNSLFQAPQQQQNQPQNSPQQQQNQPQNSPQQGAPKDQQQAPPPPTPQLSPQQLAMQQQWIQQLQAAGANPYQGINPQTGMLM